MKNLKAHPRYKALMKSAEKFMCLLNFNHALAGIEFDHKGSDFRQVDRCNCGKRKEYGAWTDDNHLQGYGKSR